MPDNIKYRHGVRVWAYRLKFDDFGRPDMAWTFPPAYGFLSAVACQTTYDAVEANVAAGQPAPPARFFIKLKNDAPDWDEVHVIQSAPRQIKFYRDEAEAVKDYEAGLLSAIAAVEATADTLRAMLPGNDLKGDDMAE